MCKSIQSKKYSPTLTKLVTDEGFLILSNLCKDLETNSDEFKKDFKRLLKEKTFLQDGGALAFGLDYKYTFAQIDGEMTSLGLGGLRNFLKPIDKMLYSFIHSCGLQPEFKVVYRIRNHPKVVILSGNISPFPLDLDGPVWKNMNGLDSLREAIGGEDVKLSKRIQIHAGEKFGWLKPIQHINNKAEYLEKIGNNQYSVSSISRSYVLVVSFPKWTEGRGIQPKDVPATSENGGIESKGADSKSESFEIE
ncbi:hypothetical protein DFP73DRAFT_596384 [Morchella snyderi]|nr:hypothetical protein DFP73DRAFT_596384 [Morchella snyderi]